MSGYNTRRLLDRHLRVLEKILCSVLQTDVPSITPSVNALVKRVCLAALKRNSTPAEDLHLPAIQGLLIPEASVADNKVLVTGERSNRPGGIPEGVLLTLGEFIKCCCSSGLPYKAADTLRYIGNFRLQIAHPVQQLRFATAVMKLCEAALDSEAHRTLVQEIFYLPMFQRRANDIFHERYIPELPSWLTDPEARSMLKVALAMYIGKVTEDNPELVQHMQKLLTQLDNPHPAPDADDSEIDPAAQIVDLVKWVGGSHVSTRIGESSRTLNLELDSLNRYARWKLRVNRGQMILCHILTSMRQFSGKIPWSALERRLGT
ncbi:hypothetical protein DFH06DRAFT_1131262 [Mycena polygramma]|nr:hypothetical protein DFH06DRAFT_1131262 [Mycena polygramma]